MLSRGSVPRLRACPLKADVTLIELEASDEIRHERKRGQLSWPFTLKEFEQAEKIDLAFARRIYTMGERLNASLTLDTSRLSIEACAQSVISFINDLRVLRG
jgi:hypothetical protein